MSYTFNEHDYRKYRKRGKIIIPPITDSVLVFPFDQETKKFDKNFYSSSLTDGRLSSNQVTNFLEEVEETFKKKFKKLRALKIYLLSSLVASFFALMLLTTTIFSDLTDEEYREYEDFQKKQRGNLRPNKTYNYNYELELEENLFLISVCWLFFLFGALFWSIILAFYSRFSQKKALKEIQDIIERKNQFFITCGLRWSIPLNFPHYIELWKDYRCLNVNEISAQSILKVTSLAQAPTSNQNQRRDQIQLYPNSNQTFDQTGYLGLKQNFTSVPLLNSQTNSQNNSDYMPPYPIMFMNNN